MKSKLVVLVLLAFLYACGGGKTSQQQSATPVQLTEISLEVSGMTCEMCVASVEKGIAALTGIDSVKVVLKDSVAFVRFDANQTSEEDIVKAVIGRGYTVKGKI